MTLLKFWLWVVFVKLPKALLWSVERLWPFVMLLVALRAIPEMAKESGWDLFFSMVAIASCTMWAVQEFAERVVAPRDKKIEKLEEELKKLKYGRFLYKDVS